MFSFLTVVTALQNGLGSLQVSWTSGGPYVTGYIIYYEKQEQDGGEIFSLTAGANDSNVIIAGLIAGVTYSINVSSTFGTLRSTAETAVLQHITIGTHLCSYYNTKYSHLSLEPATISLASSPSSSVTAGNTVTLTCSVTLPDGVTGTPDFQWEGPSGVTLTPADSTTSGQTVSSDLTLSEISTSQAGLYNCTAILSGSISTSTIITVQSKRNITHAIPCCILSLQSQCPLHPYLLVLLLRLLELHSLCHATTL